MPLINNFHEVCQTVVDHQTIKALNYAVEYAKYGLTISDPHEAHVQALYLANNISYWRGDTAKLTRAKLKAFITKTKGV